MELNKCSRCGAFHFSKGDICPNCVAKDNLELSTFKNFVEKNGYTSSLDNLSVETGISSKNLNRYLGYVGFKGYSASQNKQHNGNNGNNGITLN